MTKTGQVTALAFALCVFTTHLDAATIKGKVVDASGKALEGVTVSAFDEERNQSISVFSQADGSFTIDGLRDVTLSVRARLMGQLDEWQEDGRAGSRLSFAMQDRKSVVRGRSVYLGGRRLNKKKRISKVTRTR